MEPQGAVQVSVRIDSKEGWNRPAFIEILANLFPTKHAYVRTDIA